MPRVRFVTVTASSCLTLKRVPNRSACFSVFDAPPPALCWYFRQPESATTTTPHTVVTVLTLQLEIASTISGESFVSGPQLLLVPIPCSPPTPLSHLLQRRCHHHTLSPMHHQYHLCHPIFIIPYRDSTGLRPPFGLWFVR
ncbi:unnamed protein product [Brassica oleracea var. botrytis]